MSIATFKSFHGSVSQIRADEAIYTNFKSIAPLKIQSTIKT